MSLKKLLFTVVTAGLLAACQAHTLASAAEPASPSAAVQSDSDTAPAQPDRGTDEASSDPRFGWGEPR